MNEVAEILQTFFAEARELLARMEAGLLQLEDDPGDVDAIHAVFRAAHTIKGSAGLFDLRHIVAFTHQAETLLMRLRDGALRAEPDLVALLLQCGDHLGGLLDAAQAGEEPVDELLRQQSQLIERLAGYLPAAGSALAAAEPPLQADAAVADETLADEVWHISVRYFADLFRKGMSPSAVLRQLAKLGRLQHVGVIADGLPPAERMDPESCYLGFEIRLAGATDKARIEEAFEFVADDCQLRILPPGSQVADYIRLIEALPEDNSRLGELLVACGALTPRELAGLLDLQASAHNQAEGGSRVGEIAVGTHAVHPRVLDAALRKQGESRKRQALESQMLRVQAAKLDRLIDRVGELVISSAGIGQIAHRLGDNELLENVSELGRLIEDLRDGAMRLRMVEIGDSFARFRRIVHDLAHQLGKDIDLELEGSDTELDKSLVEQIGDPLTHLVRNAIDHGIESPERRQVAGKPARGRIRLSARHEAGHVVIEVADDGGGLRRDAILAKARQQGLLAADAEPSDAQVWQLIFEPGFSTAAKVSDISGRGVGMDVVRRNIEALRGSIDIESVPGAGSTFRIRLPLTLAIVDGFQVEVAGNRYVAPLAMVIECLELPTRLGHGGCLDLRGEVLPLLSLREHFGLAPTDGRQSVLVVGTGLQRAGLVVDALHGELQAVIKPMGPLFARLSGIAGSTILGSGDVALVLDIGSLLADAARRAGGNGAH